MLGFVPSRPERKGGDPANEETWEGQANLACRVATMIDWIEENVHVSGQPFCGTGQSGGSSQLAYTATHYGLDSLWTALVLTSGPPHSDLLFGCTEQMGCNSPDGCYGPKVECGIDWSFGNPDNECDSGDMSGSYGPCQEHPLDEDFEDLAGDQSIALDPLERWDYTYPGTVVFLFGQNDNGAGPPQQEIYFDKLDDEGTTTQRIEVLGVGHDLPETADGADAIYDNLVEFCVDE